MQANWEYLIFPIRLLLHPLKHRVSIPLSYLTPTLQRKVTPSASVRSLLLLK